MASVELEEVVKKFGGVRAVDRVSLTVGEREFFTLLGPSGCGKTTTLRLVAGLEYPEAGRVLIGGREVTRTPPARRRIAMVFQNYALYPHMTVAENIAYPLKLRKVPRQDIADKVRVIAHRLGIEAVLDRFPAQVSGGQQQRTALARAMVQDPLVFLFDEPLSNLDARLRLESRRFLKQALRETAVAAIYVTHDQTEAMALSDRVGVMKEGKLVQVAPPAELYSRPASVFVAGFVGHLPMNLVEGEAVGENGLWFRAGGFAVRLPKGVEVKSGSRITLGARPEDLELAANGGIKGVVEDVEPQGSEWIVTVTVEGVPLVLRHGEGRPPEVGAVVDLSLPPTKIHVFDAAGLRVDEKRL
jgi:multiple sugar transport system ATP-binding protein